MKKAIGRSEHSKYTPNSAEVHELTELFSDIEFTPFKGNSCKNYNTREGRYHISIPNQPGWTTGKPCEEIIDWLNAYSIYGADCENLSFELKHEAEGVYRLCMRFTHIIGGYALCYTRVQQF